MDETFDAFHRVLSFGGITIFAQNNSNTKLWISFQITNFIIGIITFVSTTVFVAGHYSDLLLFIQAACIWTTGVIMTISLGICLVFRSEFREFLDEMAFRDEVLAIPLIGCVMEMEQGDTLMKLKRMVTETQGNLLKLTRVLLKGYVGCVWLVATLYLCGPIYEMAVREDESLRLLAFDMWFPWSLQNFHVYIATFIFHAYAGYLCCVAYPGLQLTIFLLVGQVIRQLRILNFVLVNLNELVAEILSEGGDRWQECCTDVLSQCFDHYVKLKRFLDNIILSFSNRLNKICRPFYLTLIIVAIMLVGMCSVKIAISDKLSPDTMKYYVHELCYIVMVLMFCLLGQQVDNECVSLAQSITEKWYIFNRQHLAHVRIFQMAITQKMSIFIFGSITLSLPTFTWFIKTGMSFFTLVMSVFE